MAKPDQNAASNVAWIVGVLLLLPVLYIVSYVALLQPTPAYLMRMDVFWGPTYRIPAGGIFNPIHWLDRKVRYTRWHAPEYRGDDGFTPLGRTWRDSDE